MTTRPLLDRFLVFVGCYFVSALPVYVILSAFLPPDVVSDTLQTAATSTVLGDVVRLVVANYFFVTPVPVALPLAIWYWRSNRSLGDLGVFYFWTIVFVYVLGFAAFGVIGVFGAAPSTDSVASDLLSIGYVSMVYVLAYWLVYRDGYARLTAEA